MYCNQYHIMSKKRKRKRKKKGFDNRRGGITYSTHAPKVSKN